MSESRIQLELNFDEALVLFEFLSRYSETDRLSIDDQSEQRVLWNLCCDLEKELVEPFSSNYEQLLNEARRKTRDSSEIANGG